MCHIAGSTSPPRTLYSYEAAKIEAERLAREATTSTIVILVAIGACRLVKPVEWLEIDSHEEEKANL